MVADGPAYASAAGCAFYTSGGGAAPSHCQRKTTHAGLIWFPHSRSLWWSFACVVHASGLEAARPLNDRDRAELSRRREKLRATLQDKAPWVPDEPLARGAEGLRILERARAGNDNKARPLRH